MPRFYSFVRRHARLLPASLLPAGLLLVGLGVAGPVAARVHSPAPPTGTGAEFIENRGQWPAAVRFATRLRAGQLFLEDAAFTYALLGAAAPADSGQHHAGRVPGHAHAYRLRFEGAAPAAVTGTAPSGTRHHYLQGAAGAEATGAEAAGAEAAGFARVRYTALYPGTDLDVYENARQQLEYTFTLQAGASPAALRLRYEGLDDEPRLDAAGNLLLSTSLGRVTELAPRAWQLAPGSDERQPVACAFRPGPGGRVGFEVGTYDAARPLVIDPVVLFATFSGATADNWGHTSAYDAQGNFYSAGTVFAAGYPVSTGAYDASFNGSVDVAIIKYNTQATGPAARVWATYLGGGGADAPHRLVVDNQNQLLILGTTSSANFPTTAGAFNRRFRGGVAFEPDGINYASGSDLFVARLSADGANLLGSTLLGGFGNDGFTPAMQQFISGTITGLYPQSDSRFLGDVQLDATGQVVLTGCTSSRDFVGVSAGGSQPIYGGGSSDAVVCCLSADLTRLVWGTYLGGDQADAAYTLALAPGGAVYVGGGTGSGNFPAGGFAAEPAGGTDGFVSRYGPGGALQATARLGTRAHDEQVSLLALTETGDVLALGMAPGIQGRIPNPGLLPVTPGRYAVPGGNFLAQCSPDLQSRRFQTTFGATGFESTLDPVALGCDPCGNIYAALVGWAGYAGNYAGAIGFVPPAGLPTTAGSFPVRRRNFYAMRFSPGVRSLDEAWVLPGNHTHGTSRVAPDGRFYLAVCGTCDRDGTFQLLPGVNSYANIPANSNNCNDASLLVSFAPSPAGPLPPQVVCADAPAVLLGGFPAGGTWRGPGVSAAAGGYQFQPAPVLVGVQTLAYEPPAAAPAGCATATTITQTFTVLTPSAVQFDPVLAAPFCATAPPVGYYASGLSARPPGGYFSGPGVNGNRFSPTEAGPGTHTLTYTLPGATGVCGTATQTVVVLGTRLQIGPRDTALCGADLRPFQLRASPPGGTWRGPGVTSGGWFDPALATGASPTFRNVVSLTYTYSGADGCRSEATLGVGVVSQVEPSITLPPAPVCPLAPGINFYAPYTLSFPGFDEYAEYSWDFGDGSFSPSYVGPLPPQTHTYNLPGTYAPKLTVSYLGRCSRFVAYAPFTVGEASPLPNIITPNRDGLNETLVQRQFCQPPRLQVFSRWGQRVYQSAAYDNSWAADGLPAGTYFYLFEDAASPQRAKGWVEVVR